MSNKNFKFSVGDLVYIPTQGTEIYEVEENVFSPTGECCYTLECRGKTYTEYGHLYKNDAYPRMFIATKENRTLLNTLYGVEFDKPFDKNSSEATINLLNQGKSVLCYVSDESEDDALSDMSVRLIESYEVHSSMFFDPVGVSWDYAVPVYNTLEFTTGE